MRKGCLPSAFIIAISAYTGFVTAEEDHRGLDQNQLIYTRDYMAKQRFFDRIAAPKSKTSSTHEQIESDRARTSWELSKVLREYPLYYAASSAIPYAAIAIPAYRYWGVIDSYSKSLPLGIQLITSMITPSLMVYSIIPITTIIEQSYYGIFPPSLQEAHLIIDYGSKKNQLPASTQAYIEEQLFYSYWQSPSPEGLIRIHKILNKALRLPVYTKKLVYDQKRIFKNLDNYPPEIVERLDRFALTEIMFQKMNPKPTSHYPIYFQGEPGTGKTHAAKQIAEAMDTTLASVTLDGATIDDIVGTAFETIDARAGRLLDAIIANTNSSSEINHHNQILMIDEFDRLLVSNDRKSEEVLAFMLKLLDPAKRYYYSPYLKMNVQLPDSIILAGNMDIQSLAEREPRFAALTSRIETVYFSGFLPENKQQIAENSLIPQLEKCYQSLGGRMSGFKLPDRDRKNISTFIETDADPGLRSLEKFINSRFEKHLKKSNQDTFEAP